eukprot:9024880-Ditylum_brightwellii.AAC.1
MEEAMNATVPVLAYVQKNRDTLSARAKLAFRASPTLQCISLCIKTGKNVFKSETRIKQSKLQYWIAEARRAIKLWLRRYFKGETKDGER